MADPFKSPAQTSKIWNPINPYEPIMYNRVPETTPSASSPLAMLAEQVRRKRSESSRSSSITEKSGVGRAKCGVQKFPSHPLIAPAIETDEYALDLSTKNSKLQKLSKGDSEPPDSAIITEGNRIIGPVFSLAKLHSDSDQFDLSFNDSPTKSYSEVEKNPLSSKSELKATSPMLPLKFGEITAKSPMLPPKFDKVTAKSSMLPPKFNEVTVKSPMFPLKFDEITAKSPMLPLKFNEVTTKSPMLPLKIDEVTAKSPMLPLKSDEVTAKSSMLPLKSDEVTAKSSMLPQKSDEVTAKSSMLPQKSDEVTAKSSMLPQKSDEVTAKSSMLPLKSEEVTAKSSMLPLKSEEVTAKSSMLPLKSEEVTAKSSMLPQKSEEVTAKSSMLPLKSDEVTEKSSMLPLKSDEVTAKSSMLPLKSEEVTAKSSLLPPKSDEVTAKSPILPLKFGTVTAKSPMLPLKFDEVTAKSPMLPLKFDEVTAKSTLSLKSSEVKKKSPKLPRKSYKKKKTPLSPPKSTELKIKCSLSPPKSTELKIKCSLSPPKSTESKRKFPMSPPKSTESKRKFPMSPPKSTELKRKVPMSPPKSNEIKKKYPSPKSELNRKPPMTLPKSNDLKKKSPTSSPVSSLRNSPLYKKQKVIPKSPLATARRLKLNPDLSQSTPTPKPEHAKPSPPKRSSVVNNKHTGRTVRRMPTGEPLKWLKRTLALPHHNNKKKSYKLMKQCTPCCIVLSKLPLKADPKSLDLTSCSNQFADIFTNCTQVCWEEYGKVHSPWIKALHQRMKRLFAVLLWAQTPKSPSLRMEPLVKAPKPPKSQPRRGPSLESATPGKRRFFLLELKRKTILIPVVGNKMGEQAFELDNPKNIGILYNIAASLQKSSSEDE